MITYSDTKYRGPQRLRIMLKCKGSVIPGACCVALPNMVMALVCYFFLRPGMEQMVSVGVSQVWTAYNFVLGFLIVFRTQNAYTRFWEGATLLQQVRGEWFNSVSSLVAFCSRDKAKKLKVEHFQHFLVRLASMLYCAALQQVSVQEIQNFEIIENAGMDRSSLRYLYSKEERCEVIIQWIQRLIVDANSEGTLQIPPPILSRAFQELSRGKVNLDNARKIKEIPFPFPYTQMITFMLVLHWIVTPVVCSLLMPTWWWSVGLSSVSVSAFWSMDLIASEIENPFGDDANDLPVAEFQMKFNKSLATLLEDEAQTPPTFSLPEAGETARRSQWHAQVRQSLGEKPGFFPSPLDLSDGAKMAAETPNNRMVNALGDAATMIMPPTPKGEGLLAQELQIIVPDQPAEARSEPPCVSFGAVKDVAPAFAQTATEEVSADESRIMQPKAPKSVCFGTSAGFGSSSGGSAELLADISADVKRIAVDVGYVHWRNDVNRLIDLMEQVAASARTPTFR